MRRYLSILLVFLALAGGAAAVAAVVNNGDDDNDTTADPAPSADGESSAPADSADSVNGEEAGDDAPSFEVAQIAGDDRDDGPSALEDMTNPAFPTPLIDPETILSGGPPPDGIPAIDQPRFQAVADVDWLEDTEPVLALDYQGEARAYPIQIMTWHEIVNDTVADSPITVSYCPLCNSAIAFVRELDGRTLDFGTSGRLYNSSLVMYDRQSESLWLHYTGEAVIGPLTGSRLETIPVATVSWAAFRDANPEGIVLARDTGFERQYGRNPYPGYDDVSQNPFLFSGDLDDRLPAKARVVAVRTDSESIVVSSEELAAVGVATTTLDGAPVVLLQQPGAASALDAATVAAGRDVGSVGVFRPSIEGRDLSFERTDDGFVDAETGSTWDILGRAFDGELAGSRLDPVEHLDTFWFAIAAFEPDTRIVEP